MRDGAPAGSKQDQMTFGYDVMCLLSIASETFKTSASCSRGRLALYGSRTYIKPLNLGIQSQLSTAI